MSGTASKEPYGESTAANATASPIEPQAAVDHVDPAHRLQLHLGRHAERGTPAEPELPKSSAN